MLLLDYYRIIYYYYNSHQITTVHNRQTVINIVQIVRGYYFLKEKKNDYDIPPSRGNTINFTREHTSGNILTITRTDR